MLIFGSKLLKFFFLRQYFFLAVDVPTKYSAVFKKKSALIEIVAVVLEADFSILKLLILAVLFLFFSFFSFL